jgi:hypothetical protein
MKRLLSSLLCVAVLAFSATSAHAQIVQRSSSSSSTSTRSSSSSSTVIGPGGVVSSRSNSSFARDSASQFANFQTSPGGVSFSAGASEEHLRSNSQTRSVAGPGFNSTSGSTRTTQFGQSQVVQGSVTPSGTVVQVNGQNFFGVSGSNFQRLQTSGGVFQNQNQFSQMNVNRNSQVFVNR